MSVIEQTTQNEAPVEAQAPSLDADRQRIEAVRKAMAEAVGDVGGAGAKEAPAPQPDFSAGQAPFLGEGPVGDVPAAFAGAAATGETRASGVTAPAGGDSISQAAKHALNEFPPDMADEDVRDYVAGQMLTSPDQRVRAIGKSMLQQLAQQPAPAAEEEFDEAAYIASVRESVLNEIREKSKTVVKMEWDEEAGEDRPVYGSKFNPDKDPIHKMLLEQEVKMRLQEKAIERLASMHEEVAKNSSPEAIRSQQSQVYRDEASSEAMDFAKSYVEQGLPIKGAEYSTREFFYTKDGKPIEGNVRRFAQLQRLASQEAIKWLEARVSGQQYEPVVSGLGERLATMRINPSLPAMALPTISRLVNGYVGGLFAAEMQRMYSGQRSGAPMQVAKPTGGFPSDASAVQSVPPSTQAVGQTQSDTLASMLRAQSSGVTNPADIKSRFKRLIREQAT